MSSQMTTSRSIVTPSTMNDTTAIAEWLSVGGGILHELPESCGISMQLRQDVRNYEKALGAYQEGRFQVACELLQALHAVKPHDVPTTVMLERTRHYVGADGHSLVNMTPAERARWKGVTI